LKSRPEIDGYGIQFVSGQKNFRKSNGCGILMSAWSRVHCTGSLVISGRQLDLLQLQISGSSPKTKFLLMLLLKQILLSNPQLKANMATRRILSHKRLRIDDVFCWLTWICEHEVKDGIHVGHLHCCSIQKKDSSDRLKWI
jgi:hypothetical protein